MKVELIVLYASRSLMKADDQCAAHILEFFALKWAVVEKCHKYVYGYNLKYTQKTTPLHRS